MTQRPSRARLLLFAFGDFAFNLYWQSIMLFLLFYYTDALNIPIGIAATTYLVASVWDGIANFAAGVLVDRGHDRFRYGALLVAGSVPLGLTFILMASGLQSVPDELYEAAKVDGAGTWSRFWHVTLPMMSPTIFFAVIIGTGGLLSQAAAARLFTLSLPALREQLLGARAAAGLVQVAILSLLPSIVIVAISPLVGRSFPLLDALAYALCAFVGSAVFFSFAFLLSSIFANVWTPVVLAMCAPPGLGALDRMAGGANAFSLLEMMHGASYFSGQGLPWPMLLATAGLSLALLFAGTRLIARQDF